MADKPRDRAGTLSVYRFSSEENRLFFDAQSLFVSNPHFDTLRKMCVEAEFPLHPTPVSDAERRRIAANYAGAEPSADDPANRKASLAFALYALSRLEYQFADLAAQDAHRDHFWRNGIAQGQIAMWWRWRCEDHERRALSREASDDGIRKAREKSVTNRAWDADNWRDDAMEFARTWKARNPQSKNVSEAARHVANAMLEENPCFDISDRHIRRTISGIIKG